MNNKVLSIFIVFVVLAVAFAAENTVNTKVEEKQTVERKWKFVFFTEECFDKFFINKDFLNTQCLKLTISKGIGVGIVVFSVILKVPQILKIVMNKSIEGLSFSALVIESISFIFTIGYNLNNKNPFTIWGENLSILIQNIIVLTLFLKYGKNTSKQNLFLNLAFLAFLSIPLTLQLVPSFLYDAAILISIVLFFGSRYPQIKLNFKNKSTGQLALITVFLQFAGCCARLFTVLAETPDFLMILQVGLAVILNGIILGQIFIYRGTVVIKSD